MRLLICLSLLLALPATALADRAPTRKERTAIRKAVSQSPRVTDGGCVRATGIRVSTEGPWASSVARACDDANDAIFVVLRRSRGVWRVSDVGNGSVGCKAPRAVRRDLDLC